MVTINRAVEARHVVIFTKGDELESPEKKDQVLETWGIQGSDGYNHMMGWKVNGYRKTGDHGVVGEPAPSTRYAKSLFESMFKGWS